MKKTKKAGSQLLEFAYVAPLLLKAFAMFDVDEQRWGAVGVVHD